MIVHLPTPKQLQYLVALHDAGHFGRAAEATFVTQSTLSAGIRELETLIGVVLVERTRRVVRFTPDSRHPRNFLTGFLVKGKILGRPCGIFQTAPDSFLLTDDVNGVIYSIHPHS